MCVGIHTCLMPAHLLTGLTDEPSYYAPAPTSELEGSAHTLQGNNAESVHLSWRHCPGFWSTAKMHSQAGVNGMKQCSTKQSRVCQRYEAMQHKAV